MRYSLLTVAFVLCFAVVLLPGCAGPTQYITEVLEVEIPIPVPCAVEVSPPPIYATQKLTPASSDGEVIRALFIENDERGIVEDYLRAILRGCSNL